MLATGLGVFGSLGTASADAATSTANQAVTGATIASLSIAIPTPAVLTNVTPGSTATGTGAITLVSTGTWTLGVADSSSASTTGHPVAGSTGCTGSEAYLRNPLSVLAAGTLGTVNASGTVALTGASQTIATGTGSAAVTATYTDPIASSEVLLTGCTYGLTATYTLQG